MSTYEELMVILTFAMLIVSILNFMQKECAKHILAPSAVAFATLTFRASVPLSSNASFYFGKYTTLSSVFPKIKSSRPTRDKVRTATIL